MVWAWVALYCSKLVLSLCTASATGLHKGVKCISDLPVSGVKGHIWLLGDFNLPKFSWEENLPSLQQDCNYPSLYGDFADIMADFKLTQMVTEPTRYENILDLFLTNNPTLVSKVEIMPGLSDHDIVYSEVNIKPQIVTQKPRVMPVYRKTDWDACLNTCSNSVNPSWWITKLNHLTDHG